MTFISKEIAEFTNNTSKGLKHSGKTLSCQGMAHCFFFSIMQYHLGHEYTWVYDRLSQYFIKTEFPNK